MARAAARVNAADRAFSGAASAAARATLAATVPSTIVIGDVHGCADELEALLRACGCGPQDEVVLVGDLVAKGPDSRGVLAIVRELGARAVRGNHDEHLLRYRRALDAGESPKTLGPDHAQVARELDEQDWALLAALPFYLRLPALNAIVVHAGLLPAIPLEQQDPDLLMNMRAIRPDGSGSRRAQDGVPWASLWPGPELVLFGHNAAAGLQHHPYAIGLDTGCVYGRQLTACLLPEQRLVSVPARRPYAPIKE
jgi:hypothetical protein